MQRRIKQISTRWRPGLFTGLAVGLLAAAAVAFGAGGSNAGSAGTNANGNTVPAFHPPGPGPDGFGHGPGFGPGHGPGDFSPPIHGEDVVKSGDTYKTLAHQRGKVTAVSSDSITVKSEDSYEQTYAVDSNTHVIKDGKTAAIGDVSNGDSVGVMGVKSGDTYTAKAIFDGKPPKPPAFAGQARRGHVPPPPMGPPPY